MTEASPSDGPGDWQGVYFREERILTIFSYLEVLSPNPVVVKLKVLLEFMSERLLKSAATIISVSLMSTASSMPNKSSNFYLGSFLFKISKFSW